MFLIVLFINFAAQIYTKTAPMGKKYDIIWYGTVDSTNTVARNTLSVIDKMSVIAAECQTAGRGQKGNVWSSEAGKNLTFSAAVRFGTGMFPKIPAQDQFAVSEAAAVAVSDCLAAYGITASVKWPNDIIVRDRKICGILIENTVRGAMLEGSVIGIGLNVNQTVFPPEVPNPTSMKRETGTEYSADSVLEKLAGTLSTILGQLTDETAIGRLNGRYLSGLYWKDELHRFADCISGEEFDGIIRGITPAARLVVETAGGKTREFAFKEISYLR